MRKKISIDWDAITPVCKECGTRSGKVHLISLLCPSCDPQTKTEPPPAQKQLIPKQRKSSGSRAGIKMNGRKPLFDPEQIKAQHNNGVSADQIAANMKCSIGTVKRVLGQAGFLKRRRNGSEPRFDYEEIRRLRKSGMTYKAVAEKVGCSQQTVYNVVNAS
jgi:DNA invertase Pin-like site-specific DNA recombinase